MENSKWTTDNFVSEWMNQVIIVIHVRNNDVIFDTLFYVPCVERTYNNVVSARKAIAMFNKHRIR